MYCSKLIHCDEHKRILRQIVQKYIAPDEVDMAEVNEAERFIKRMCLGPIPNRHDCPYFDIDEENS